MNKKRSAACTAALAVLALSAAAPVAAAVPENVAYVTDADGVAVVDLSTLETVRRIDVGGKGPRGLAISPDGKTLLTANQGTGDVSVIDTATGKVERRILIGVNPEFMRLQSDGKFAYVTYEPSSTGKPPAKGGKEENEGGAPAEVAAVSLANGTARSFLAGGRETEGIEFSPDGRKIVVANEGNDTLAVYDKADGKLVATVDVKAWGHRPRGVKISPDGKTYAVTLENSDKLLLLDADLKLIKETGTAKGPYGVAFDRTGQRIVVAAARSDLLQAFDAKTLAPIASVPVGARCWHFSFTPDHERIVVACGRSNDLRLIDAKTFTPVKAIAGFKLPWGIVTYPKSNGSLDAP